MGVYIYVSILRNDLNVVDNPLFFCNLANNFGLKSLSAFYKPNSHLVHHSSLPN